MAAELKKYILNNETYMNWFVNCCNIKDGISSDDENIYGLDILFDIFSDYERDYFYSTPFGGYYIFSYNNQGYLLGKEDYDSYFAYKVDKEDYELVLDFESLKQKRTKSR